MVQQEKKERPPIITPSRCSRRLDEKRQQHQVGNIEAMAIKLKAIANDCIDGTYSKLANINLLPDKLLLSLASDCDIDMVRDKEEQVHNLSVIRARETGNGDRTRAQLSSSFYWRNFHTKCK